MGTTRPPKPACQHQHNDAALVEIEAALFRSARRLYSRADAEDLVQETMARLVARNVFTESAHDPVELRRRAFYCARLVAHEHRRQHVRHRPIESVDVPAPVQADLITALGLNRAFRRLTEYDQRLLWLVDVEGVCQLEVAVQRGMRPGTVRSRVSRARTELLSWFEFNQPTPPIDREVRS